MSKEKVKAIARLMSKLAKGERSGKEEGWLSADEVEISLKICESQNTPILKSSE